MNYFWFSLQEEKGEKRIKLEIIITYECIIISVSDDEFNFYAACVIFVWELFFSDSFISYPTTLDRKSVRRKNNRIKDGVRWTDGKIEFSTINGLF